MMIFFSSPRSQDSSSFGNVIGLVVPDSWLDLQFLNPRFSLHLISRLIRIFFCTLAQAPGGGSTVQIQGGRPWTSGVEFISYKNKYSQNMDNVNSRHKFIYLFPLYTLQWDYISDSSFISTTNLLWVATSDVIICVWLRLHLQEVGIAVKSHANATFIHDWFLVRYCIRILKPIPCKGGYQNE